MDAQEFFVVCCNVPRGVAYPRSRDLVWFDFVGRASFFAINYQTDTYRMKPYDEDRGCGLGLAPREMVRDKASFRDLDLS
ncbi:hypothetical protein BHE74_00003404 [Ensete ventricosum]|nr:hypothetical protein BHE74_00003404 [Ensete ventricosum]